MLSIENRKNEWHAKCHSYNIQTVGCVQSNNKVKNVSWKMCRTNQWIDLGHCRENYKTSNLTFESFC